MRLEYMSVNQSLCFVDCRSSDLFRLIQTHSDLFSRHCFHKCTAIWWHPRSYFGLNKIQITKFSKKWNYEDYTKWRKIGNITVKKERADSYA